MKQNILLVGNFLSSAGWNPSMEEELAGRLEAAGYSVITTSRWRIRLFKLFGMLYTTLSCRDDYHVAYVAVYSGTAFIWAELVCGLLDILRKPYILTLHGGNLPNFANRRVKRVKRLLGKAMVVTAPSRYLQTEMHYFRDRIRIIPNPIEMGLYTYRPRISPAPRIVWLRAFHQIYNPQMAPHVVAELRKLYPDITLTMIGPDKGDSSLQETRNQIKRLNMLTCVSILGGIPKGKVPEMLAEADIFINTSNVDNTPVSVIEAMACGLCIVSTNAGGIHHLLTDGENALLVPPDNPQAMAHAIEQILDKSDLASKLSRNARYQAEQFDWKIIMPVWDSLFKEII